MFRTTLAVGLAFYCLSTSAARASPSPSTPSLCTLTMRFDPTAVPNADGDSIAAARTTQKFRVRAYALAQNFDPNRRSAATITADMIVEPEIATMLDANATIEKVEIVCPLKSAILIDATISYLRTSERFEGSLDPTIWFTIDYRTDLLALRR